MGERMQVTVAEVCEMFYEYVDILQFFLNMDNNVFTMTYTEYQAMPALTMELFTLYKNEKQKFMNEQIKAKT